MSIATQIRRAAASPEAAAFNPQNDITWHSLFWAEGSAFIAEGYSDTDNVTAWPNETGESDANNPSVSTRPYDDVNAAYNNQPTVFMNGVLTTDNFTTAPTYPVSIVIIGNAGTLNVDRLFFEGNDCSNRSQVSATGTGDHWRLYAGTIQDAADNSADTSPHLIVARYDGSTGTDTLSVDGVRQISGDAGSQTIDGVTLAGNCNQQNPLAGDLAFVGVYEGDITGDAEWWNFLDWVETHYGISVVTGDAFNPESDITWHSLFWAEGTDFLAQGYGEGDPVGTWPNETGESDAVQAGADSVKPTYRASTAALNSQPTVQGDGGDGLNTGTFTSNPDYTAGITVVAIGQVLSLSTSYLWSGRDSSNRNDLYVLPTPASWNVFGSTTNVQVASADTDPHMLMAFYPGTTFSGDVEFWEDGTSGGSTTGATQEIDGLALFCRYTAGSTSSQAHLALIGIYEGDITTDPNYDEFVAWVSRHYGVSAT